jgi:hypothetical protein
MDRRSRKLAFAALLTGCVAVLLATAPAARTEPLSQPAPSASCAVWNAYLLRLAEQHKEAGASGTALGEALSLAYATYAKCVMCGTDKDAANEVVAMRERVVALLAASSSLAMKAPSHPAE